MDRWELPVIYADIFDYPLTPGEIREWAIGKTVIPRLTKRYYTREGREHLIGIRKGREGFQKEKWDIARRAGSQLALIPTIVLVGVTGGLAMNNARKEDDIDLFVITKKGTLWISRILSILSLFRMRRTPHAQNVANKICLNMFMTEDALAIPEQDLFAAHEILQMKPLWQRKGVYRRFLKANSWVYRFLPNAKVPKAPSIPDKPTGLLGSIEPIMKKLQLWYMRRHRTTEVITETSLRFHPKDARVWVKQKLQKRLRAYRIPLDKIFYAS